MGTNSAKIDEELRYVKKSTTLLRLFSYMKDFKKDIVVVLFLMAISITVSLLNPMILERAIDVNIANKDYMGLIILATISLGINLIFFFAIRMRMKIMARVVNSILATVRKELYIHIQTLDFNFFDSRPTGKILARIIGDVNALRNVLSSSVTILIPDFLTIIAIAIIMFAKHARLALAALLIVPFMAAGLWFVEIVSHKRWQINKKKTSNVSAYIHENLSGMRVVQSFCAEEETSESFAALADEQRDSFVAAVKINDIFFSIINFSSVIGAVLMYFVGIQIIGVESITIGTFIAFSTYLGMFWNPISNLGNFYNQLVTNISGAERIFEILDTDTSIENDNESIEIPDMSGQVIFNDVSFSYIEDIPVLDHVSFQVNAGETIALVGPTGAGKSTIINLVSRFYDVTGGEILIDGINIRKLDLESLRSQLGIMTQDNFIFSGTIRDNIKYGNQEATDEEMIRAAEAVCAHDFISKMKDGYDTTLQERGTGLSEGQKQLLAFARTMLMSPKILILDEATSSIDTKTEILVQKGIASLVSGRTSFIIAHRLSTIQNADRIFVIDDNHIVESGTPSELMNNKGFYYNLYMAQFKEIS